MKYNLIRNGYFTSLTTSGTGNVDLSWSELESLMDGNLTSSGISINASDVLCLETNLSQRIKVDGIRLYTSDLSKSTNIKFYYKNTESDSYTILTTQSGASYYYTSIPAPSAPQFIRATISGAGMNVYEFQVFNDDYIVAFGEDGNQYSEYITNAPVGEIGAVDKIAIYNNSTSSMPANAYTCIDYTGNEADNYLEIANNENGPFYNLTDGVILENNDPTSTYIWNMGNFSNTKVSNNSITLSAGTSGTYTTPIFGLDDSSKASYFTDDSTTTSGFDSISYDENTYNGTIRIKSSDTKPITINKIFWSDAGDERIDMHDVYTNTTNYTVINIGDSYQDTKNIAVNRHNGRIAVAYYYSYHGSRVKVYNQDFTYIDYYASSTYGLLDFNVAFDFDNDNGLWGYSTDSNTYHLIRINENYDDTSCDIHTGSNFLYDFAVEWDGTGLWYTDQNENTLKHIDYKGVLINSFYLQEPRGVCATSDNGCWVSDNTADKIYRYGDDGSLVDTIEYSTLDISSISRMAKDFDNGFWFKNGNGVGHINDNKQKDLFIEASNISRIRAGHKCCIVFSYTNDDVRFVDLEAGAITFHWTTGSTNSKVPGLMSFSYEDYKNHHNTSHIIPASYDPVWGTNGTAEWKEVRKDGYFLPKYKYHQIEYTLRSNDSNYNPSLNKVILAPAVKISDIQPNNYKNLYVRTNIPLGADITTHESRIKTWWGENE